MHQPTIKLLPTVLLLLPLWAPTCHAERADRDKPVHLEADQVLIDDAQQISTFTGNVKFTQGTLQIQGDKIVVVQDKEGFKRGTIYGNTASFRQKREGINEYVEGYAERIEYDTRAETINFYVQARLKRELDEVRGEHITYSAKTEIFQVNGDGAGNTSAKRVHAILQSKTISRSAPDKLPIKPGETLQPVD